MLKRCWLINNQSGTSSTALIKGSLWRHTCILQNNIKILGLFIRKYCLIFFGSMKGLMDFVERIKMLLADINWECTLYKNSLKKLPTRIYTHWYNSTINWSSSTTYFFVTVMSLNKFYLWILVNIVWKRISRFVLGHIWCSLRSLLARII